MVHVVPTHFESILDIEGNFFFMEDFKAAGMTRLNNLYFRQRILTEIASV